MESMKTHASSTEFLQNILRLKQQVRHPLPSDVIIYHCKNCDSDIPLNSLGVLDIKGTVEEPLGIVIDRIVQCFIQKHTNECPECLDMLAIDPDGPPKNILVSFPESDKQQMKDFNIANEAYTIRLMISQERSTDKVIFALYQMVTYEEETYSEFIECNFHTFLNMVKSEDEEDLIYDDECVNQYQHCLPRMIGGGRTLNASYNYECIWCPKEVIQLGKKGRFRELRSYREHFRAFHHSEDGTGVPMVDFLEKVQRVEPTWFCRVCKRHLSLGNVTRHKAICKLEQFSTESETDDSETVVGSRNKRFTTKKERKVLAPKRKKICIYDDTSEEEAEDEKNTTEQRETEENIKKQTLTKEKSRTKERDHVNFTDMPQTSEIPILVNLPEAQSNDPKRTILDDSLSCSEETRESFHSKHKKQVKIINTDYSFLDVDDEIYCSSSEDVIQDAFLEPKIEQIDDTEIEIAVNITPVATKDITHINKWWLKIPKHLYGDKGLGGPKIFLPTDSEEFVKRCTERYKKHQHEKLILDRNMKESESESAKLLQFSEDRDKPFLEKYTAFVRQSSAKDAIHLFSDEYEQLGITGAKASTAGQYKNRVLEFFKYMARKYNNFHLDWLLDFKSGIEKVYPDGNKTNDIFLPTKEDLTEFIKQFKYGGSIFIFYIFGLKHNYLGNPAANCGIRIFALKKLLSFLEKEIKDHEHVFVGNIIEKSKIVKCLVERISSLDGSICPEGTVKHLATASNKSHKKALLEQLEKCPERNITSIMKGVGDYINSEEFNIQRTLLVELACNKSKVPTSNEYMNSTQWLLEQLICLGGNRPCALLGITLKDWAERRPGFCPFFQDKENEMEEDNPNDDSRMVLKNPYKKPKGSSSNEPTGIIVKSETDKITVGAPCYIWFPNALADLVNDHSLMAQKVIPRSVDLYHPKTRLFLNSKGREITKIECKHFKNYIGLPMTAYDFRRSLSTFCLDNKNELIRSSESSVLRHKEATGFAYYYQKHGERVEYVSIQYALKHGLIKADMEKVDHYCLSLRKGAKKEEWELSQKRTDKALEYGQRIMEKKKKGLNESRQKGGRNWILPQEYDAFIEGVEEAILMEERRKMTGQNPGPFSNVLNYKPGTKGSGTFPPLSIWQIDMYRVMYGLSGEKGDAMRQAELSVYDRVPFSEGFTGRKKIVEELKKGKLVKDSDAIVANYWLDKIKAEARQIYQGKWLQLRFIFTEEQFLYNKEGLKSKMKLEI